MAVRITASVSMSSTTNVFSVCNIGSCTLNTLVILNGCFALWWLLSSSLLSNGSGVEGAGRGR